MYMYMYMYMYMCIYIYTNFSLWGLYYGPYVIHVHLGLPERLTVANMDDAPTLRALARS